MITNQSLAELLQRKLNGERNGAEYANLTLSGLDKFTPNVRYEFKIFANDGEYEKAKSGGIDPSEISNTVTQYIHGVLKTPNGAAIEGAAKETYNAAIEAQLELLIPNCDDIATFDVNDGESVSARLQDAVHILVSNVLGIPTDDYISDGEVTYFVGTRYHNASIGERRHRTQAGLSVILTAFMSFAVVAMGVSSRKIKLKIDGEAVYFSRISVSRSSTQENNVTATAKVSTGVGVAKARTTATQLVIGFSAPVRPTALNKSLTSYIMTGEVETLVVTLTMPTDDSEEGEMDRTYNMVFAEGGVAGEENLNAAYDIRLVERMDV